MSKTNKNIITYFLESKLWKDYETNVLSNIEFWKKEDPSIAYLMESSRKEGKLGLTVEEYIYGMLDCTHRSKLAAATKSRLYKEISDIEIYHTEHGTLRLII